MAVAAGVFMEPGQRDCVHKYRRSGSVCNAFQIPVEDMENHEKAGG